VGSKVAEAVIDNMNANQSNKYNVSNSSNQYTATVANWIGDNICSGCKYSWM
jgi:hypothetical protein